jgi:membrane protease YdiL (CAAX protease family)
MPNIVIPQRATDAVPSAALSTTSAPAPTTFIKRHPVLAFYMLAFAISWVGIFLVVGGPANFPGTSDQVARLFPWVMLAWLAGPSIASVLMTGLIGGRPGYRQVLARLHQWRVGALWYAVALLAAPIVYVAIGIALSLTSPAFLPSILVTGDRVGLLLMGLAYGLFGGGFLEELGWTGFAVPRLRQQHSALKTSLIVGVLWGAYHFSVIFWASSPSGKVGMAILLAQLFAWLPAYRVLMVWVYERTQSLLVAMLMHASLTAGMLILQPAALAGEALLTFLLVFAATWWLVVAAVGVASRGRLSRHALRTRTA